MDLKQLFAKKGFKPTPNQESAIFHVNGPLFLPAGPGSGKTRVLLWRTLNLVVNEKVDPSRIFLSTFTEKAARQLQEGLRSYLSEASLLEGKYFDVSQMYVGTIHSLCQKILTDRRFQKNRVRGTVPRVLDDLEQVLFLTNFGRWERICASAGLDSKTANRAINGIFGGRSKNSSSKQKAIASSISAFNRFSEECLDPEEQLKKRLPDDTATLLKLYRAYRTMLEADGERPSTDLSLLQQKALNLVRSFDGSATIFEHLIIDEYQDTNFVQEQLFFELAKVSKNLCVVGDDDQALYRFRGATVENFVQFPERVQKSWKTKPKILPLDINFRSRKEIVDISRAYLQTVNWKDDGGKRSFRVEEKVIKVGRTDSPGASVVFTEKGDPEDCAKEIARFVKLLIDKRVVESPNQIAFLYPSLKNKPAQEMMTALKDLEIPIYAPRAQRFLENDEVKAMIGVLGKIFGVPEAVTPAMGDWKEYRDWLDDVEAMADTEIKKDKQLGAYISEKQAEIQVSVADFQALLAVVDTEKIDRKSYYVPADHGALLGEASGLSARAKKTFTNTVFRRVVQDRLDRQHEPGSRKPFSIDYVLRAATSVDWTMMDIFWQLTGFRYFKSHLDAVLREGREKEAINLSLLSGYIDKFVEQGQHVLTAADFSDARIQRRFFSSYLYCLFVRQESEYEDGENPFPRECVPFLTIHQSKGLEFPVVLVGDTKKKHDKDARLMDQIIWDLKATKDGEPLDRMNDFDTARLYYVALSRAQNLLVVPDLDSSHNKMNPNFRAVLDGHKWTRIKDLDLKSLPAPPKGSDDIAKTYSYTSDYLFFRQCGRQYLLFRELEFVPSRTQSMVFGSLVHKTIEDLHHLLIAEREDKKDVA